MDYFDIRIADVISQQTAQQVVTACGLSTSCPLVQRNPDGSINVVTTPIQNFAQLRARGEDFEIGYSTGLAGGELSLRALATHTEEISMTIGATKVDRVGDLAINNNANLQNPPAAAAWTGQASADYRRDQWRFFGQVRYVGSGEIDHLQIYAPGVDTHVPATFYVNLTVSYALPTDYGKVELYSTVNNLLDQDPRITPQGTANALPRAANGLLYDFVGRYITMGAKLQF